MFSGERRGLSAIACYAALGPAQGDSFSTLAAWKRGFEALSDQVDGGLSGGQIRPEDDIWSKMPRK